jgi:heme/copper-type cytochrome/quinol oxidase subunit 3
MVPKTKTTQILYRFEYSSTVLWVFGMIFVALLAIFVLIVRRKNKLVREFLRTMPRQRRIIIGVGFLLVSFLSAGLAILALPVKAGKLEPAPFPLLLSTLLSAGFVAAQTIGSMCLISLVTEKDSS